MLERLIQGESKVSYRNRVPLKIEKLDYLIKKGL